MADREDAKASSGDRSFLKSPTGIAAIAALISAVVGLLTFLVSLFGSQTGASGTPGPSTTTTITPTAGPSSTPHDVLLAHVPLGFQPYCTELDTLSGGAIAGVSCHQPQFPETTVSYYLFEDRATMYAFFTPRLQQRKTPAGAICGEGVFGESTYSADGEDQAGQLLCFKQDGRNYLEWTRDAYSIYAWIESSASSAKVFAFWRGAGPISSGDATPSVAPE